MGVFFCLMFGHLNVDLNSFLLSNKYEQTLMSGFSVLVWLLLSSCPVDAFTVQFVGEKLYKR